MQPGVVVFAIGNRSRGDDAIGPLLLERMASWLPAEGLKDRFELIDDYQLQIEHALDLKDRRLALFIDAGSNTPGPFQFYAIVPSARADKGGTTSSTHELPPQGVLDVYRQFEGADPPPAFVLCVRGERFELGEGLSSQAQANAEAAWRRLKLLCLRPHAVHWRDLAGVAAQ